MRTKNQIRASKSKGRGFERDCEESLKVIYPEIYMTHEKGYIQEYDLRCDTAKIVIECKKHRSITWNEAEKFFDKLSSLAPKMYKYYLLFKSNQQPCLVMYRVDIQVADYSFVSVVRVEKFETYFKTKFVKHTPIQRVKR